MQRGKIMDNQAGGTGAMGGLRLTERIIPVPMSISPEAQAALAMVRPVQAPFPALDDKAGWYARIEEMNTGMAAMMRDPLMALPVKSMPETIAGVPVFVTEPETVPPENRDKALLYFHGGGLVLLGGEATGLFARMEAFANRCKVFAVDYRNPPDHPYPAALDDCVAVYRELLKTYRPNQIVISGASGGGNLAAAVPLKIRDLGLPLPAAVGLFTPEVDLTESGDTFHTNRDIDVVLRGGLPEMNALYANGADLADPYLSPLFGDFTKGFPPTFIQTGTRDVFLSNSARIHRALRRVGIETELHVWEAMPHGGFGGAPEDQEMRVEFAHFLAKHGGWAKP
jgi:monoterpene epsilon-lactone hydrolase